MRKFIPVLVVMSTAFANNSAHAEDKKPEHELSFNMAVVSDYRPRGLSQTTLHPALQGGADYTHNPSGLYLGIWASTVKWTKDSGGNGNIELDIYGGKRGEIAKDVPYDVGLVTYVYPSNRLGSVPGLSNADTTEIYGQIGFGYAYAKYLYSLTNLFGFDDTKRSGYLDIGANIPIANKLVLNLHAGHQTVKNNPVFSYTDWRIGLTKNLDIASVSLSYSGTDTDSYIGPSPDFENIGKNLFVLSISKVF